jgi:hypothetical protein
MTPTTFHLPRFPEPHDIMTIWRMSDERAQLYCPVLAYRRLLPPVPGEFDEVHGEVPEYRKRWDEPLALHGLTVYAEEQHPMTVFGVEEAQRDLVVQVSVGTLIRVGLVELTTEEGVVTDVTLLGLPGDRLAAAGGVLYDVLEWRFDELYANTALPLIWKIMCEKVRDEA